MGNAAINFFIGLSNTLMWMSERTYGVGPLGPIRTTYRHDHLGSTRIVTNAQGSVVERHDYLPFGEEIIGATGGWRSGVAPRH
jgi:hypothetical protein